MSSENRNPVPSVATQNQVVAVDVDFNLSGFGEWLEQELTQLVDKHSGFSTARSNCKFFER